MQRHPVYYRRPALVLGFSSRKTDDGKLDAVNTIPNTDPGDFGDVINSSVGDVSVGNMGCGPFRLTLTNQRGLRKKNRPDQDGKLYEMFRKYDRCIM